MTISRVPAAKIGVEPALIRSHEDQGLIYFIRPNSQVVGAQCANCNAILWVDPRRDVIFCESKPIDVPESGIGYRRYFDEKIRRFLASMPDCPGCGQHNFDRFVNNVNYPRFSGGGELKDDTSSKDVIEVGAEDVEVALLVSCPLPK